MRTRDRAWRNSFGRMPLGAIWRRRSTPRPGLATHIADAGRCVEEAEALLRTGRIADAQELLRAAPSLAPNRQAAAPVALRASALDAGFKALIASADQARDMANWPVGERYYLEALEFYPDHFGYLVQLAHCLKEQRRFAEAEINYRTALALTAPAGDILEHLRFVAGRQGLPGDLLFPAEQRFVVDDDADLAAPPTKMDVQLIYFLFLGRSPQQEEILEFLRSSASIQAVIQAVVEHGDFIMNNPELLYVVPAAQ